jgi:hemoglobin-like flavoprotein
MAVMLKSLLSTLLFVQVIMALSKHAIDTVKATAPAVAPHVQEITALFYNKMLGRHPELFQFFNKSSQKTMRQPRALADAVLAYAGNIENLGALGPAVERMRNPHILCRLVKRNDYCDEKEKKNAIISQKLL